MTNIFLDFDNVLANTTQRVLDLANYDLDMGFTLRDIIHYDFHDILGITKKELWNYFLNAWEHVSYLKPIDDVAYHLIKQLQYEGYNVEISTGCGIDDTVEKWLEWWEYPKLKVTYIKNGANKIGKAGDIIVDDNPKHIEYAANTDRFPIVFDRPWNRDFDMNIYDRAYGFKSIYEIIGFITSYKSQVYRT